MSSKLKQIAEEMLDRVRIQATTEGKGRVDKYLPRGLSLNLIYKEDLYTLAIGRYAKAPSDVERHLVFEAFGIPQEQLTKWRPTERDGWFRIWYQWSFNPNPNYQAAPLPGLVMTDEPVGYGDYRG